MPSRSASWPSRCLVERYNVLEWVDTALSTNLTQVFRDGDENENPVQSDVPSHRFVRHGGHDASVDSVLATANYKGREYVVPTNGGKPNR